VIMKKYDFEILKNLHGDYKEVVFGMLFVCIWIYATMVDGLYYCLVFKKLSI
jgi:hypothetical protein